MLSACKSNIHFQKQRNVKHLLMISGDYWQVNFPSQSVSMFEHSKCSYFNQSVVIDLIIRQ